MSSDINKQDCRVCLKEDAQSLKIFENPSQKECYAMMLTAIADIKIFKGDSLPENICSSCSKVLLKAYKLKVLAVKTNAYLQLKSKQIIIKKLDPDLVKLQNSSQITIKKEPKVKDLFNDDDIFSNKSNSKRLTKKKVVNNYDFFAKPVLKNIKKTPLKDIDDNSYKSKKVFKKYIKSLLLDGCEGEERGDRMGHLVPSHTEPPSSASRPLTTTWDKFFTDNNINDKESLFGDDDHFADNDDFDITFTTRSEPGSKKPRLKTLPSKNIIKIGNTTILKKALIAKKKLVSYKQKTILPKPKPKPKFVPKQKQSSERNSGPESFVCTVCGILTTNIRTHMNTHKEHKFTCPVCKMGFGKKSEYHAHEMTHNGVTRNFVCDVCPMRFFTNKALKRHKTNHAAKTFQCDHCPYKINSRWALTRHVRTHLGIKPYSCGECGRAFTNRCGLLQHARVHTDAKGYSCQICNVEFSYKTNLNNHVLKAHGVNLRFQSIHKVTEENLRMVIERAAIEGIGDIGPEARSQVYSQSKSLANIHRKTVQTVQTTSTKYHLDD